jgi:glyoxylase-like metal-dependent hydrolase (beta-lactamase superfamily II)
VISIVFIDFEGKISDNYYLLDGMLMGMPKFLSIYVIENNGERLMIDTGEALKIRKIMQKMKEYGIFPIYKLILTHSHWDHAQGIVKLKEMMKDVNIEVYASENAMQNLKNPQAMNEGYNYKIYPFADAIPLKEGDVIDLKGLKLDVINVFGHTMDSIALFDKKNKNVFLGDSVIMKLDYESLFTPLMPPDFHESALLKTFEKLRSMRNDLNSLSIAHFGVWKGTEVNQILDRMEDLYNETKAALIQWYKENNSIDIITENYCQKFIPNSKVWNVTVMKFIIKWMLDTLKRCRFIT